MLLLQQAANQVSGDLGVGHAKHSTDALDETDAADEEASGVQASSRLATPAGKASSVDSGLPFTAPQHVVAEEMTAPVEQFPHLRVARSLVRRRMPALH